MREVLLWITVFVGYGVSIYFIVRSFVFAASLLREVPFVPTGYRTAREAIDLLDLKAGDKFVDIGSGNGKVVLMAAGRLRGNGEFVGVEISIFLILISRLSSFFSRYRKSIRFIKADMLKQDYSKYNKVFMFLTTELVNRMARKLDQQLPKGSKIVSVLFKFDEEFVKTHNVTAKDCKMWGKKWKLYLWTKE